MPNFTQVKHRPHRRIPKAVLTILTRCLSILTLTLPLTLPLSLQARQPGYFILGEAQFKGLQVYDVVQDELHRYLFSTNEGIYAYDFNRFQKIGCADARSTAVFNFVTDSRGTIYCANINHQVFRIRDLDCSLWYELEPDEVTADMSLAIGPGDMLLVVARKVIAIDPGGRVRDRFVGPNNYWGRPFTRPDGAVYLHQPASDTLLRYTAAGFQTQRLQMPPEDTISSSPVFFFFQINGREYAIEQGSKRIFAWDVARARLSSLPSNPAFARSRSIRLYQGPSSTWIAGTLPGVFLLDQRPGNLPPELWFENFFISDVYLDHEGNWLLSTFDKGVLVVPNLHIPDVIETFRDDPVTALYVESASGVLYLGTSKGSLLRHNGQQLDTLHNGGMRPIEGIHGAAGFPWIVFDDGAVQACHLPDLRLRHVADYALKDVVVLPPDQAYLGTNLGLLHCQWDRHGHPRLTPVPGFRTRVHLLANVPSKGLLYVSTSTGLYATNLQGSTEKVMYQDRDIFPTAMQAHEDTVYVATQSDGILALQGHTVARTIQPRGSQLEVLRKLRVAGGTLWAKSSHAIHQFAMDGTLLQDVSRVYGFPDARIYDFVLHDSLLWVSHAGGVQAVDLRQREATLPTPELRLDAVRANGAPLTMETAGDLPVGPTKLQFQLASPTLRAKERLRFQYRLQGYDSDWIVKPNDGREIVYNALAPGSYTFVARAELEGRFGPAVRYSFTIATPLHARTWFVVLAIVLAVALMALVFAWLLRRQRKKAQQLNELNASKLTAIQSQMNPHFLFNALNSIQDLVLKGDVENSYSYITTFSNLVRSTLQHSDRDFIDFDQELRLLTLYLQLEGLRFKDTLTYHIDAEGIEDIQVPPLLIQPFVENALLHGLLHLQGPRILHIKFTLGDHLICTIQDNGIGRQKARAIRERQRGDHESFSGKAIRKRFDILSEVFHGRFGYHYDDLMVDGQPAGTRVTLTIPIKRQF